MEIQHLEIRRNLLNSWTSIPVPPRNIISFNILAQHVMWLPQGRKPRVCYFLESLSYGASWACTDKTQYTLCSFPEPVGLSHHESQFSVVFCYPCISNNKPAWCNSLCMWVFCHNGLRQVIQIQPEKHWTEMVRSAQWTSFINIAIR